MSDSSHGRQTRNKTMPAREGYSSTHLLFRVATLGESSKAPVVAGEPFWTTHRALFFRCMATAWDLDDDVPVDGLRDPADEGRKKLKIADFSSAPSLGNLSGEEG